MHLLPIIWASLVFCFSVGLIQQASANKGPPSAELESATEKVRLGQNVKLVCPIQGDPPPIYEWYKDGEKIDHFWLDYVTRNNNRVLKIKASKLDDTGTFVCRGVNGFGKASVNIQLIVVDPSADDEENRFLAPDFTSETRVAPIHYFRKIGETLSVTCEAVGSPTPEIVWLKNGHKVGSGVKYIQGGKSSLDLVVLDASDAGAYTCMARNAIGSVTKNYSLEVNGLPTSNSKKSLGPLIVVTGITPANSTLSKGQSGKLTCSVRSTETPHIKWLKQVNQDTPVTSQANILNVTDISYQILPTTNDIKVSKDEYVNILHLEDVTEADNGTYICFVAKNGLTSLSFKAATLHILTPKISDVGRALDQVVQGEEVQISMTMMLIIICLSVLCVFMLIILATWYIRFMRGPKANSSASGTSETSLPESPDEHHFSNAHLKPTADFVFGHHHHQLWQPNHHVYPSQQQYPLLQHHQLWPPQPQQKVTFRSASHHEMLEDNQYEVPFGHLMPVNNPPKQHSFYPGIGSMTSMQDQLVSSSTLSTPFLPTSNSKGQLYQTFLPRSNSMRPPQFYHHHVDT